VTLVRERFTWKVYVLGPEGPGEVELSAFWSPNRDFITAQTITETVIGESRGQLQVTGVELIRVDA
jgi:hypothetical protein